MKNLFMTFAVLLLVATGVLAQDEVCSTVREHALATTFQHCNNVGPNEVCYGYSEVASVVNCDETLDFTAPGDIIPLQTLCAMRLSAMSLSGQWGIAVMNVAPEVPEQGLTYILFGDVEIQNAASANSQMRVWVTTESTIRSGPGSSFDSISSIASGEVILVNACNCTRNWLRTVLNDGRAGWILARNVSVLGDTEELPVATSNTPIYESMEAFTFSSGHEMTSCAGTTTAGVLIQSPAGADEAHLRINNVEVTLTSTIFAQSQPGHHLTISVLDGIGHFTANGFAVSAPAGTKAVIPLSDDNLPSGLIRVEPFQTEEVVQLPMTLLPQPIDPLVALNGATPQIVGLESCAVLSDRGETICPLHFVNPDGDEIAHMNVEFVDAPQGEWTGSVTDMPQIINGDNTAGRLAWATTCSLGSANFIGPVQWLITITDEAGNVSLPFEASFNCVDG